jgi:hypothetical protein
MFNSTERYVFLSSHVLDRSKVSDELRVIYFEKVSGKSLVETLTSTRLFNVNQQASVYY